MTFCSQCGKWAGAHAILPGQSMQHTCSCRPIVPTTKREWVGLTDDEKESLGRRYITTEQSAHNFIVAIEVALKVKNT